MPIKVVNDLTAEEVIAVLRYDPQTGIFYWRYNPERRTEWNTRRAGKIAGGRSTKAQGFLIAIRINDRLYLAHRLAWLIVHSKWPDNDIDHINGDPSDNRIVNLRDVTHAENTRNRSRQSNNTTGYVGVRFREHHGKWEGRINLNGVTVWREYFMSDQEVAAARRIALDRIHGEFAPNEPHRATKYERK